PLADPLRLARGEGGGSLTVARDPAEIGHLGNGQSLRIQSSRDHRQPGGGTRHHTVRGPERFQCQQIPVHDGGEYRAGNLGTAGNEVGEHLQPTAGTGTRPSEGVLVVSQISSGKQVSTRGRL